MKQTVFIGDLHGDLEFIQFIDKQYEGWDKVLVGDYLDSHYWLPKICVETLEHVLQMCERGDTKALAGNHELSYMLEGNRCSGWNSTTEILTIPLRTKMFQLLQYYLWYPENKILVTHGGITQPLWRDTELTIDNLAIALDAWQHQDFHVSKFGWVGKARGGTAPYGGPFWCDFDEEFKPIYGITQIFGHSPGRTIRQLGTNFNINQLELMVTREVLEFKDGAFSVVQFRVEQEKTLESWKKNFEKLSPQAREAIKVLHQRLGIDD
jgi:hypothetical protein